MSEEPDSVRYMKAHTLRQTITLMEIERKHGLVGQTVPAVISALMEKESADASGIARFDGRQAWIKIAPDQQTIIGALALELVVGAHAAVHAPSEAVNRASIAAQQLAGAHMQHHVITALQLTDTTPVCIPSCVGRVCHVCGCTEQDACVSENAGGDQHCAWVEGAKPSRCTACQERAS